MVFAIECGGRAFPLCYSTNVHPGEDLAAIAANLDKVAAVRDRVAPGQVFGLGLWLPAAAAASLVADPAALEGFREALAARRLELATVNAFPYGGFHAGVVKDAVYRPDWTTEARLSYTCKVAEVAAALAPEGATIPVSTLGVGWCQPAVPDVGDAAAAGGTEAPLRPGPMREKAAGNYIHAARFLADLEERTGRRVVLAIEPEPCTILSNYADLLAYPQVYLRKAAEPELGKERLSRYVGACLDACHAAVAFEDPVRVYEGLVGARIPVAKIQASSALVADPSDPEAVEALARFAEDRWLHQVHGLTEDGELLTELDLPRVLAAREPAWMGCVQWRVHYHVPLSRAALPPLETTRGDLEKLLDFLGEENEEETGRGKDQEMPRRRAVDAPPVIEVETYTWSVLPAELRPEGEAGLIEGIASELRWVLERTRV